MRNKHSVVVYLFVLASSTYAGACNLPAGSAFNGQVHIAGLNALTLKPVCDATTVKYINQQIKASNGRIGWMEVYNSPSRGIKWNGDSKDLDWKLNFEYVRMNFEGIIGFAGYKKSNEDQSETEYTQDYRLIYGPNKARVEYYWKKHIHKYGFMATK